MVVKKIYLTAKGESDDPAEDIRETGVIAVLSGGEKFYASFFSFAHIEDLRQFYQRNGDFLDGSYFWSKNMVLVTDCKKRTIERVIKHLIDAGEFQDAFFKL